MLAFDYFLVPPYLTFAVSDTQYLITFAGLFCWSSLVISTLTARVREQAEAAIQREAQTSALYSLGRDLTSATDLQQVADIIITHISQVFGREVVIFLPENGQLQVQSPALQTTLRMPMNWEWLPGLLNMTSLLVSAPIRYPPLHCAASR